MLSQHYSVHSNYPLKYIKVFAFGAVHPDPLKEEELTPNHNQARIAADIRAIASPMDVVYKESRAFDHVTLCQGDEQNRMSDGTNLFGDFDLPLICRGWEFNLQIAREGLASYKEKNLLSQKFDRFHQKLAQYQLDLNVAINKEAKLAQTSPSSWRNFFDGILIPLGLKENETMTLEKEKMRLAKQNMLLTAEMKMLQKSSKVLSALDDKKIIHDRNKGIIKATSIPTENRKYFMAGPAHFFSQKNRFDTYLSSRRKYC